ncbi:unnamed protein product [Amoebophrya sp. A25]|nr:unnamed protein product [Amoebophrya sp. A25]|eukprot:GSA25T00008818001.1
MHRGLLSFPNAFTYQNKLLCRLSLEEEMRSRTPVRFSLLCGDKMNMLRVVFVNLEDVPLAVETTTAGASKQNVGEAYAVLGTVFAAVLAASMDRSGGGGSDEAAEDQGENAGTKMLSVAILAAYAAQRSLLHQIRDEYAKAFYRYCVSTQQIDRGTTTGSDESSFLQRVAKIPIECVDGFQGREADLVVASLVRSNGSCGTIPGDTTTAGVSSSTPSTGASSALGFLADQRRMNVLLTRGRRGLVVFGHKPTLEQGEAWSAWLKSLEDANQGKKEPTSGSTDGRSSNSTEGRNSNYSFSLVDWENLVGVPADLRAARYASFPAQSRQQYRGTATKIAMGGKDSGKGGKPKAAKGQPAKRGFHMVTPELQQAMLANREKLKGHSAGATEEDFDGSVTEPSSGISGD